MIGQKSTVRRVNECLRTLDLHSAILSEIPAFNWRMRHFKAEGDWAQCYNLNSTGVGREKFSNCSANGPSTLASASVVILMDSYPAPCPACSKATIYVKCLEGSR